MSTRNREPVRGNALDAIKPLLDAWGLKTASETSSIETAFDNSVKKRNIEARYLGVRYNNLEVLASPENAALLQYEKDAILQEVRDSTGTSLLRLTVRTR